ncbi:hypothetical protein J437_LFUL008738, partial [Ladona fulva]
MTSQSEWSDEEDEDGAASEPLLADRESTGYTTDDPALENVSMLNETGLTDAEGALSDVNSVFADGGHEGDLDDTSISSRASSRIFGDADAVAIGNVLALADTLGGAAGTAAAVAAAAAAASSLAYDSEYESVSHGLSY